MIDTSSVNFGHFRSPDMSLKLEIEDSHRCRHCSHSEENDCIHFLRLHKPVKTFRGLISGEEYLKKNNHDPFKKIIETLYFFTS